MEQPTTQDFADYYAGNTVPRERPADPGDFRFDIFAWDEPEMGCTHTVRMIDEHGVIVEQYTTDDPYGHVEQFREYQDSTFEERHAPFGPEWQREQADCNLYL